MNFHSLEFLIFLPVVFVLHWVLPHRFRWALLLGASSLFYFWWNFWTGFLLVGATLVSWLCGRGIARSQSPYTRRALLVLALITCLGCLAVFKYAGFFASLAGLELSLQIILPVGISFYTFQTLSYVIDVYRGQGEESHFGYYALFVSFFPQLVAGPIERPGRLLPQLKAERTFSMENLSAGGWLLLEGYFKKVVIADGLAPFVDQVYAAPGEALGPEIVLATVLFGLQIYCDFSGYSGIARGAAQLLGVELTENFRRPYEAASIREFWRRWHISLTSWFTDYVYIPLGGNRKGLPRQVVNLLAVFLLSGLWHGAGWTFLTWGLIHGLYRAAGAVWEHIRGIPEKECRPWAHIRTFLLVSFPWLFFRAPSMADVLTLLSRLPTGWGGAFPALAGTAPLALSLLCLPLAERLSEQRHQRNWYASALTVFCAVTAIGTAWLAHLAGGGNNAFIYFQF